MFDKKALFVALSNYIQGMIDGARYARQVSEAESRSHKGAASSRYDTFKEEAQALAGAQGRREADLGTQLALIKSLIQDGRVLAPTEVIRAGAIVRLTEPDSQKEFLYLIVPAGGGFEFQSDDTSFTTLNFSAPLCRALLRKKEGDIVEIGIDESNKRQLQILEIQ